MTETVVRIPLPVAMRLNVEDAWALNADQAGLFYDGSEESGEYMLHFFGDTPVGEVESFARRFLPKHAGVSVRVTGPREVTVEASAQWLVPLNMSKHPYEQTMRTLAIQLGADPAWRKWWADSGYSVLMFHLMDPRGVPDPPGWSFEPDPLGGPGLAGGLCVDLSILDEEKPARGLAATTAREHLKILLDGLAQYLGREHPPFPWA